MSLAGVQVRHPRALLAQTFSLKLFVDVKGKGKGKRARCLSEPFWLLLVLPVVLMVGLFLACRFGAGLTVGLANAMPDNLRTIQGRVAWPCLGKAVGWESEETRPQFVTVAGC